MCEDRWGRGEAPKSGISLDLTLRPSYQNTEGAKLAGINRILGCIYLILKIALVVDTILEMCDFNGLGKQGLRIVLVSNLICIH